MSAGIYQKLTLENALYLKNAWEGIITFMAESDYLDVLLPHATEAAPRDLTAVAGLLERRNIRWVYHFSHFVNFISIFKNGILGRSDLTVRGMQFLPSDTSRADDLLSGISLSVSEPNKWMLLDKIRKMGNNFGIIEISANSLLNKRIVAFPTNAARREIKDSARKNPQNFVGARGLSNLFLNEGIRTQNRLSSNIPTDAQSEIMVFDAIPNHHLRGIHVPENGTNELLLAVEKLKLEFPEAIIDNPCSHSFFEYHRGSAVFSKWDEGWK